MSISLQSECTFIDEQPSIQLNCSNMQSKSEMKSPSSLVWTAFPIIYMCDANGRCKYYHKCLETHFYKCSSHRAAAFYWLIHGRGSVAVASATLTHTLNTHTHTHCTTGTRGTIHPLAWVQLSVTMLHLMPSNNQFNLCWPKNAGRVSGRKDVCYIFVLGPFPSCLHVPSLWTCRRCRDGMGCTERRPASTSTDRHLGSTF